MLIFLNAEVAERTESTTRNLEFSKKNLKSLRVLFFFSAISALKKIRLILSQRP